MKRYIRCDSHTCGLTSSTHRFDHINATKGRIDALNNIDWRIDDDDIDILSSGLNQSDIFYQAMPIRKPIVKIEYASNYDEFVVTYKDGARSIFYYKEGADSTEDKKRYYWTYLGRA